ncbi:hypothetical protein [Flavobacterium sp. GCM10023249]|uniref:hypothetical protein n=1 Tax=unclassified Flavobacterium TaxID=196869 RepID=UPI003613B74F
MLANLKSKVAMILLVMVCATGFTSCTVHHHHNRKTVKVKRLPPGKAKKISGDKSARRHAPGHNK